jgi:tetratricopeptide (TPR) repeat protein
MLSTPRLTAHAAIITLAILAGCSGTGQRPLHIVKERAAAYAEAKQYELAVENYAEYVERKPDDVPARFAYGKALMKAEQPKEAREQFKVVSDVMPDNDTYMNALAEALYASGETDELTQMLDRFARERGTQGDFLRKGMYAGKLGNVDEAQESLLTAATMDAGRSVEPQLALADLYRSVGDKPNEIRRLRMALYLDPMNVEVQKRVKELGEIPGPTFRIPPAEAPAGTAAPAARPAPRTRPATKPASTPAPR